MKVSPHILTKVFAVVFLTALVGSCGSGARLDDRGRINEPTLMEQLLNSDLSPGRPKQVDQDSWNSETDVSRSTGFERYAGDDRVANELPVRAEANFVGEGYELNFSNAELSELAKVIFDDTLKIPYEFDPRIKGTVTLSTGKAVSRDQVLTVFESVITMNGGALVKQSGRYRIIPIADAKKTVVQEVSYANEREVIGPGYGVTVVPLRHISSSTMLKMLSSFSSDKEAVKAEIHQNLLFIRGSGEERKSLTDIAATFDVDWIRGQSVGVFPIQHTTPVEIIRELNKIFQAEAPGLGQGVINFQPIDRLNAVLVVSSRAQMLDRVATWVDRLDRSNSAGQNLYVYRVENGKAKDLASVLNQSFGLAGLTSTSAADEVVPGESAVEIRSSIADQENGTAEQGGQNQVPNTAVLTTGTISSGGVSNAQGVRIIPDEVNNKLLIRATGRVYQQILKILRKIDRPPLQVLINATLAEVTLNDNLRYGVQFYLNNSEDKRFAGFSNGESLVIQPELPGLNLIAGALTTPRVVLDALSGETNVKVVSSPSLVVLNNQSAVLNVGDEVPIITRQTTSVEDPLAPIVNNIDYRDTGVILKVTPRVNSNGLVTMEIEQEISTVANTTSVGDSSGTLTPTISQRKIASTIAVYSGQMVVLGGLIQERKNDLKNSVPGVKRIPVVGDAIGRTDNQTTRTELVIFLRPKVIRDAADASNIAEELRARLQSVAHQGERNRRYHKMLGHPR